VDIMDSSLLCSLCVFPFFHFQTFVFIATVCWKVSLTGARVYCIAWWRARARFRRADNNNFYY